MFFRIAVIMSFFYWSIIVQQICDVYGWPPIIPFFGQIMNIWNFILFYIVQIIRYLDISMLNCSCIFIGLALLYIIYTKIKKIDVFLHLSIY